MSNGNGIAPSSPLPSPLPHVEAHEQAAAEFIVYERVKALCGKYPPRIAGYYVAIMIHQRDTSKKVTRDDGTEVEFFTHTDITRTEDKYQSMVGLVVGVGSSAYKGQNFDGSPRFPDGPWVSPGQWCIFPRYEGVMCTYRNLPLLIVPDDKILGVVEDPDDIIATHLKDR